MEHRVVVTGVGAVTPLGMDVERTWEGMIAGRSGVGPVTLFETADLEVRFGAEVRDFDPEPIVGRKEVRRTDRFVQFAIVAAAEALENAKLEVTPEIAPDIGVLVGSGIGGITTLQDQIEVMLTRGPSKVSPFLVTMMEPDMASGQVSIRYGLKGPNYATVSACSSGADAIGSAYETIRRGDALAMLSGGAEAGITRIGLAGFAAARALSERNDDPGRASRPFDKDRDGFVMGEGAGILVLEQLEFAKARGARILAEVIGYGATADAFHITQPAEHGEGAARAMSRAIQKAQIDPGDIDYINAHGTSTQFNDRLETEAIKTALGEHAYRVAISSTKSMTGHLLGAAGAVEAIASVLAIRDGIIPPTINYQTPDPDCDLDYTPNETRRAPVNTVMSNSFGFGGHNSALIFRRYEPNGQS